MICYTHIPSPIGMLTAVSEDGFLTAVHLRPAVLPQNAVRDDAEPVLTKTKLWLELYFAGNVPKLDIPMKPSGTDFQRRVWALLSEIPYGVSVTYGSLARKLGNTKMSAQAVGQAVGKNPINILVPCHRVLGVGGTLTGYAYGLDTKRFLLDLEKIQYR